MSDILLLVVLISAALGLGYAFGRDRGRQQGWAECQSWRDDTDVGA